MDKSLHTLTLQELSAERLDQHLFKPLNITLQQSQALAIQGANGSGKTTLLRILAGLLEPTCGRVLWQGQSITHHPHYQQHMQYIGHQNGLKPYLTVYENLQLFSTLSAQPHSKTALKNKLATMNLLSLKDQQAQTLSAGQSRRLSLTRLLLKPAALWILDEPLTALDRQGQQLLLDLLNKHQSEGGMTVLTTHQPLMLTNMIDPILLEAYHV